MLRDNYYNDNPDIQFILEKWTDWRILAPIAEDNFADASEYQSTGDEKYAFAPDTTEAAVELYKTIAAQYGEIMGKELAPVAGEIENTGLKLKDGQVTYPPAMLKVMDIVRDAGLIPYATPRRLAGMGIPLTVQMAAVEITARAHVPFSNALVCFNAAEVIAQFGSEELISKYVPQMTAGQMAGAMAFTEPNYGSDLKNILTKAEKNGDGFYYITGTKRFITHACGFGDKPAAILTLARSGGDGAKGLSFFLVESGDVEIAKLEDKMGQHTSPTCEVVFEKSKAQLIGEEGAGLVKYAMAMMNAARLGVAAQAVGLATAAFKEAEQYAAQRIQFKKTINQIPAVERLLNEADAYVQAMRAILYRTAVIVDSLEGCKRAAQKTGLSAKEIRRLPEIKKYDKLATLLTPVSKLFATEKVNTVGYNALQVFGGAGYTEEYDIARIVRDMRITSIYEGTSQLQVVAAIGSIVEGLKPGGFVAEYIQVELNEVSSKQAGRLQNLFGVLLAVTEEYRSLGKYEREYFAWDIVFAFSYFFGSVLLEQQTAQLTEENSAYGLRKQLIASEFYRLTACQIESAQSSIGLAGSLPKTEAVVS